MIEITIKTLDSRNHEFTIPEDVTVKQLKEQIAESVNVPAESQRLIYCGRVLLDDKKLSEYDVNGKVIHLVQRAPPSSGSSGSSSSGSSTGTTGRNGDRAGIRGRLGLDNAMYLGAMAFPADLIEAHGLTVPPTSPFLINSRFGVARTLIWRANNVLQALEGRSESDPPSPAEPATPDQTPSAEAGVQAAVTISTDPLPSTQGESNNAAPTPEQIAAAAAEAVTAALGHALNVHHGGNVSITVNNGRGIVRVVQENGSGGSDASAGSGTGSRSRSQSQTRSFADLVALLRDVQRRMEPYLDRYYTLMREDPADAGENQQLFNQVSELMHIMAHTYHAFSDIMCDLNQPPPRMLRCRPVLIQQTAVLQAGIPIQVPASQIINLTSPMNNNQTENGSNNQTEGQARSNQNQTNATEEENQNQTDSQSQGDGLPRAEADNTVRSEGPSAANGPRPAEQTGGSQQGPTATVSINPSNLEIFMDVSAGAIAFDSVEAAVLHASSPAASRSPAPEQNSQGNAGDQGSWNQVPPNDFLQNLFHRFYSEMSNIHNNNYNNNNNNSNNSTSGNTSSAAQQPSTGAATATPAATSQNQASSSDSTSSSTSSPIEGETTSSSQPPQPNGTGTTRNTTRNAGGTSQQRTAFSRPHIHIGSGPHLQSVDYFDPYLPCNSHHIRGRRRGGGGGGANAAASNNTTGATNNTSEAQPQQQGSGENLWNTSSVSDILQAHLNSSGSSGTSRPTVQMTLLPPGPNRARSIVHHIIPILPREIVRNLQANNGGYEETVMRSTVAQLLESIPGQTYTPGQSLIMDLFMTAGRNIMLQEIMTDVNPAMLGWMRPGLQEYLENRLGVDSTCPEATIQTAVDRINAELTPFFQTPFEGVTMREDVDLPASICKVSQACLPQLIKDIHQADNFTTYTMNVSRQVLKFIRCIIGVLAFASQTPRTRINGLIFAFSRKLVQAYTAEVRSWLMRQVADKLYQLMRSWFVSPDPVGEFIVYALPPQENNTTSQPVPMEIEECVSSPRLVVSSPLRHSEPPLPNIILGSEPWHRNLPADWVPIITQDRERQRRGANQGPLSDAYLAGMPSKRRKLLTDAKPNSTLNKVISESMGRALGAAGLTASATADLVEAAACDSGLRTAYKAQVRSSVESTLRSHPDYHPDKYPNTAKYFNRLHRS